MPRADLFDALKKIAWVRSGPRPFFPDPASAKKRGYLHWAESTYKVMTESDMIREKAPVTILVNKHEH